MAKTEFDHATIITPEFLNAINNPTFSETPSEDGQIPIPPQIPLLSQAVAAITPQKLQIGRASQNQASSAQWINAGGPGTMNGSDDADAYTRDPHSHLRIGDGLFALSLEMAINRAHLLSEGALGAVEIRLPTDFSGVVTWLSDVNPIRFRVTVTTNTGLQQDFHALLSQSSSYAYLHFYNPADGIQLQYQHLQSLIGASGWVSFAIFISVAMG